MYRRPVRTHALGAGFLAFLSVIGLQSQAPTPILPADPVIVAGSGPGGGQVAISTSDGSPVIAVAPFGAGFTGGVRVATGDINGDGVTDVVAAMASQGGQVRAFSGRDGSSLGSMTPFGSGLSGGVFAALGDVNADGHDDLLLGAGSGGLAQLIDGATRAVLGAGRPFASSYTAGVTVAIGDVNGDGRADLIFGTTFGGFVRVFDFPSLEPIASGFPYGPLFAGGVNVAAGDVDGDGADDVAVAPRNAGGPVRIYNIRGEQLIEGSPFTGVEGVSLAMGDLNGDGHDDLVMGAGAGATPRVRAFSILDRTPLFDRHAFDAGFRGGVFVATPRSASTRFTSAATATFTVGAAGTFAITTRNGRGASLSVGGSLPAGVTFTDHGDGTATLAGTPAPGAGGSYALTWVATRGARQVAQQPFTLVVQEGTAITSASATTFAIGGANAFAVTTTGFPAAAIAASGLLPAGVALTDNGNGTATLAGSPAPGTEGTYPLTLSASNGLGAPATQAFTLTVVASGTPLFTSAAATTFTAGAVGSFLVTTSAMPSADTITVSGALPAGVTFTNHGNGTATLAGAPDAGAAGVYPLLLTADNGVASTPQNFTLTVNPVAGGAPSFTSGNTVTFAVGAPGGFTVTTTGSPVATMLTSSGALPAGVTFTNNGDGTATLAGTAAAGTAGNYPLAFTAGNGVATATQLFTLTVNNVGSSPVFTSGATTAFVIGASETFAITTAASPAVTGITLSGTLPAGVAFTDRGDGTASLDGTPQAGTGGAYALIFTATNGGAPVDQAFTLSVQETAAITSAATRAFTVEVADSFTVTTAGLPVPAIALTGTLPSGVTFTDNGDGTATMAGTAAAGTAGPYPVTLTATNGVGTPGTQAFTLNVTQNTPPTLDPIPDPAAILEDAAPQTITLTGVTAGAGDSQPLAVTAQSSDPGVIPHPAVTYTSPNATGTLHYTPVPDASGAAVITVTVTDGGLDNDLGTPGDNGVFSRTFTVAVTAVNDPPTLDAIADPAPIDEDAPQQTIALTGITTGGGETQVLQVTATSDTVGLIPHPTVSYTAPAATGSLSYTPVPGASGTAIITVTVTDGGLDNDLGTPGDNLTATDTFTVTVNDVDDPPTLDAISDPAPINEDASQQTVNLSGISAGAGETAVLNVTAVSSNPGLIPHPTVIYTSPNATGSLSYAPAANTSGSAVITVAVSDGGATPIERTFTVVVNEVNDAPTFTPGANQTVAEDAPAQTVNAFLGTVSAGPNEATQIVTVTVDNVTSPSLFSAGPAITAAGVLTYTPAPEQFGISTITYTVSDNGGTANGGVDSSGPQTFTITITAVNDPPTLGPIADPAAILEDAAAQTIGLTGISAGPAAESAQPIAVTAVSLNPALIPNPTVTYASPDATGSLTYTPVANASGSATIQVTVTDGGLDNDLGTSGDNQSVLRTFTVNVTGVNDPPSFTPGAAQTVAEDAGAQSVPGWATAISAGPGEGSQTVSFQITNNTNPALFSAGPAVSSTGALTYTPAANQNGIATITLRLTDNGGTDNGGVDVSAAQTLVITVTPVNDPPVPQAKSFNAQANMRSQGLTGFLTGVVDADAGVNGCTPTFTLSGVGATSPAGGTVTITDAANGIVTFDPPPGVTGAVTFSYTVTDDGCPLPAQSGIATATVTVAGPVIWFVDSTAPAGGNGTWIGTNTRAFRTTAEALAVDAADHRIFILNNAPTSVSYAGSVALNGNQWLVGQGAIGASFDAVMGITAPVGTVARPAVGGVRPTLTAGTLVVSLSTNNIIRGLNAVSTGSAGVVGSNVGALVLADVDVSAANGAALSVSGSGSITVTGDDNDLVSSNNSALSVSNVAFGAAGLRFKSISAGAGANNGIHIENVAGTGGLTVTGADGGDPGSDPDLGSGGTITGKTGTDGSTTSGTGVFLSNTANISLNGMIITNHQNYGVRGAQVDGFRLTFSLVGGVNGTNVASPFSEGSVSFIGTPSTGYGLRGTVAFLDNEITGGIQRNVSIDNATGTMNINFLRNNVHHTNPTVGDDGLSIEVDTSAVLFANVSNNTFTAHGGDHFNLSLINSANADLTFRNNDMQGGHMTGLGQGVFILGATYNGTLRYDISNNGTLADPFTGNKQGGAIFVNKGSGTGTFSGQITNNVIGDPAVARSGSEQAVGIHASARGAAGSHTTLITGNAVRQYFDRGIVLEAGEGAPALIATVTNNTVSSFADAVNSLHGIHFDFGILTADNAQITVDVRNNLIAAAGNEPQGGVDFRMRTAGSNDTFIAGYTGGNSAANAQAFVDAQNVDGTTFSVTQAASGTYNNGPPSPLPAPSLPTLPPAP